MFLNGNRIKEIPLDTNLFRPNFYIDLSNNAITSIPKELNEIKLENIKLEGNKFSRMEDIALLYNNYENVKIFKNAKDLITYSEACTENIIVFKFWATWCKPCVEDIPCFEKLTSIRKDVKVIFVNLDFLSQIEKKLIPFLKQQDIKSDIVRLEDQNVNAWLPLFEPDWDGGIPYTIVVKKNESKRKSYLGAFTNFEELNNFISN